MSASPILPRNLLCSLLLCSAVGCHHRSVVPESTSAPDRTDVHTSLGIQSSKPNQPGDVKTSHIVDLFAGRFAGVQVQRTGAGKVSVRLRGVEPLVVVDGLEGDSHLLLALNPRDVVRIDVLKDTGSTAIYGNRGLNGVIVITTRRDR
jgi:TonB-dependent SusC/RagA subfamily outer membrane receptor